MSAKETGLKKTFLQKQKVLENARKVLKREFTGIDKVIDEIIDNVSSWYFLPGLQEKPVVVNLWGLTGVGKTSLVNRLAQLIGFETSFYRFDLGEKEGSFSFRESLDGLCENSDTTPVIIALDEMQHARTVTGPMRQEIDNDKNRMIWELLDSGKIRYVNWKRGLWSFEKLLYKLQHLVQAGVEVQNGLVTGNVALYCNEMEISAEPGEKVPFFPEEFYGKIIDLAGEQLGLHLYHDVENILFSGSVDDNFRFLKKVLRLGKKPDIKNFTKALIFVLGNLDEAYVMSGNFSADMDADEFHRRSLKITVPKIKKALQSRFRNEQIARLGNIHIIYPALSRASYKKIIENELTRYAQKLKETFGLTVEFDRSVHETVYNEGVYPTQGVRPVFTSIHQVLKSKISLFYTDNFLKGTGADTLSFCVENNRLVCHYRKNGQTVYRQETPVSTSLEKVRENKRDDLQAITAVHESGHTVLSIVLLHTLPNLVYSVTADVDSQGFVQASFAWQYISRKELLPRVAMMLGGNVAEELIFGKENLTAGASSDIEKATDFLSEMYKKHGMGKTPIKYGIPTMEIKGAYHHYSEVEEEIKTTLEEAKRLAEETLKKERKLLLVLADYLSDNRVLRKEEIRRLLENTVSEKPNLIEEGDDLYYRAHLKKQVEHCRHFKSAGMHFDNVLSLNKRSKS